MHTSHRRQLCVLLLFIAFTCPLYAATLYDPQSDGTPGSWQIADAMPEGAAVRSVEDEHLGVSVTQTVSTDRKNAFRLGGDSANNGWNNTSEQFLHWSMRTNGNYNVYVRVDTSLGWRYLYYNQSNRNSLLSGSGRYIHHGLGSASKNGHWQSWSRDLTADLADAEPNNTLLAVHGILVRGTMSIANIALDNQAIPAVKLEGAQAQAALNTSYPLHAHSTSASAGNVTWLVNAEVQSGKQPRWDALFGSPGIRHIAVEVDNGDTRSVASNTMEAIDAGVPTIYSNAEDGTLDGWTVRDNSPDGAVLETVSIDLPGNNYAIKTEGTGYQNAFVNGSINRNGATWNNGIQQVVGWSVRANANFRIYVGVDTHAGWRMLWYDARDNHILANSNGRYIHHGLGSFVKNDQWVNFYRDLNADLQEVEPGNRVLTVHGIQVRGSILIDDVLLRADLPEPADTDAPVAALSATPDTGTAPLVVELNATASLDNVGITSYQWLFGDGQSTQTSDTAVVSHNYSVAGDYTAEVIVSDLAGNRHSATQLVKVLPVNQPPIASFTASTGEAGNPLAVTVDASSSTDDSGIQSYTWTYADGLSATGAQNTLIFSSAGIKTISLRVIDEQGLHADASRTINLSLPVPDVPQNLSPDIDSDLQQGATTSFTWAHDPLASSYDFHFFNRIDRSLSFVNAIDPALACNERTCLLEQTVQLPIHDDHAWRVRARNATGISGWSRSLFNIIAPVTTAPQAVTLIAPVAGAAIDIDGAAEFTWNPSTTASEYQFEILDKRQDSVYATSRTANAICKAAICSLVHQIDVPAGDDYSWRVRALNAIGSSDWQASTFNTRLPAARVPAEPVNETPVEESELVAGDTVTFAWQPSEQATFYDFHLFDNETKDLTFSNNLAAGTLCDERQCTFTTTIELPVFVDHAWRVRAGNSRGVSSWSRTRFDVLAAHTEQPPQIEQPVQPEQPTQPGDIAPAAAESLTSSQAARLLSQASFGASTEAIADVQLRGIDGWIEHQFNLQGPAHLDYVKLHSNGSHRAARHEIWWKEAIDGEDQLRLRIAYALSQLFVISDTGFTLANAQYGVTHFYDQLRNNAFGNYRDVLETVTLSPVMGIYLSMLQNRKADLEGNTRADENYAREVLQLFSIGLYTLNQDGSTTGENAFTQTQVEEFARVFTGWNYKDAGRWDRPLFTNQDMVNPMEPFEQFHDSGSKTLLLGHVSPAGLDARDDLDMALDNIFSHPNVGPFIGKHLIQQLVTSNPSPSYISRVAAVFNDNGAGVRGDLKAVIRQVLLDNEAREGHTATDFGKLREPVLRLSHLWRAFNIQPGAQSVRNEYNTYTPMLENLDSIAGQAVLRSPSVFNFYQPDHAPAGPIQEAHMVAPVFQIFTDSNLLATGSRINNQIHRHYASNPNTVELNPSYLDFMHENALAIDVNALLEHLDILLLSGSMSDDLRAILAKHLNGLPTDAGGLKQRARDAVSLIMASPDYLIQK